MKPKKLLAAVVALALAACLVPRRAFAYVDYSGDQALTQVSAVYQFLKEFGGASDLPDVNDTSAAEFYANILGQTATPFYSFLYNYSYYAIFAGWRVYQASDFEDADAQSRYQASMDAAVEYLEHEWAAWVEEYPGAGGSGDSGGSSAIPQGSQFFLNFSRSLGESVTFQDGKTFALNAGIADEFNRVTASGCPVYLIFGANSGGTYSQVLMSFTSDNNNLSTAIPAPSGDCGVSVRGPRLAESFGFSDSSSYWQLFYVQSLNTDYAIGYNTSWYTLSTSKTLNTSSDSLYPSNWWRSNSYNFRYRSSYPLYIVSSGSVWTYGVWSEGNYGPSAEPTGPTAPDYDTPEPYEPVNPTLPNVTNNVTNNWTTYTGNETDYSDFLKIIIDNQKEQIKQVYNFAALVDAEWDGFVNWLNVELDNILGYLYNYQQLANIGLNYAKDGVSSLFSIDGRLLGFRSAFDDSVNKMWGYLQKIIDAMPGGSDEEPEVVYPDVEVDVSDDGEFWEWIFGILGKVFDALVGSASAIQDATDELEGLTGIFPFSIPWDLIGIIGLLAAAPVADYVIQWPMLTGVTAAGGATWSLQPVDLSAFSGIFSFIRYGFLGIVALGIAYKTKDMAELLTKVVD